MATIRYFTTDQAVRLTGLSRSRLRYWHSKGFFVPEHLEGAGSYKWLYSFRDLVNLRVIAKLVERGPDLRELRRAARQLKKGKHAWQELVFGVDGKKVFWKRSGDEHWEGARPPGQLAFIVTVKDIAAETEEASEKLHRRDPEDIGKVTRHRFVAHNAWVISGTRVTVSAIKAFAAEGYEPEAIREEYPQLELADIRGAMAWEDASKAS